MSLSLSHLDSRHPRQRETLCGVSPWDTAADRVDAPAGQAADGEDDLVVGIAAAAGYLGYDNPDSFRRARTRHPIPGETRTSEGRPAWNPRILLNWHSQRKLAGKGNGEPG